MSNITVPLFYGEDILISFLAAINEKTKKAVCRPECYYVYYRNSGSMMNSPDLPIKLMKSYYMLKPIVARMLEEIQANPNAIQKCYSEGLWAYRASVNGLIKDGRNDKEILPLIEETEKTAYLCMTKDYFRTHPEHIWAEEMHFMISDYTPQEYLDWCKAHLPPISKKEKLRTMIKKVIAG